MWQSYNIKKDSKKWNISRNRIKREERVKFEGVPLPYTLQFRILYILCSEYLDLREMVLQEDGENYRIKSFIFPILPDTVEAIE
jgi:hypothetical protein